MNLERALKTDGWMDGVELEYLASLAQKNFLLVELGSWKGRSTLALAQNTDGVVLAIDAWESTPLSADGNGARGPILAEFQKNTQGILNILPIIATTDKAAQVFAKTNSRFDVVFIDACHDYEQVCRDISNWRPLLTENGILAGHDFVGDYPGVAQAVKELVPKFRLIHSIWSTEEL